MKGTLAVVDYGMGNIHSLIKALRLFYDNVVFTGDHNALKNASALVLPGDGAFAAAMDRLNQGIGDIIFSHLKQEKPMLGVCIGFQVLFEDSDEVHDGNPVLTKGLGIIPGNVRRFRPAGSERVPHMGWNQVKDRSGAEHEHMYFIHSYRAEHVPAEFIDYTCEYAGDVFPAAVKHGSLYATQFHPEKSDRPGLRLIEDWISGS